MQEITLPSFNVHQSVNAIALLICLLSFWWGMRTFFVQPSGYTPGMRLITICGTVFGVIHLVSILWGNAISDAYAYSATAIYAVSFAVYWWAISSNRKLPLSAVFSPDLPVHLNQNGPYQFVRHPFYCSYLLTWLAGVLASGFWWLSVTVVIMLVLYIQAAKQEEGKFSKSALAEHYLLYRRSTGMLVPNPLKLIGRLFS